MKKNLWGTCLTCEDKCCAWDIAFPLFATSEERKRHSGINTKKPCIFLNEEGLCRIYRTRLFDCRFFPFEILMIDGKFFWIAWELNCLITKDGKNDFEKYLAEHEKYLLPKFVDHLLDYAEFRAKELKSKYRFKMLREVKIPIPRKNK